MAIALAEYGGLNTTMCVNIPGSPEAIFAVQLAEATESLSNTAWPKIYTAEQSNGTSDASDILTACAGRDL